MTHKDVLHKFFSSDALHELILRMKYVNSKSTITLENWIDQEYFHASYSDYWQIFMTPISPNEISEIAEMVLFERQVLGMNSLNDRYCI